MPGYVRMRSAMAVLLLDYTKLSMPGGNVLVKFFSQPFSAEFLSHEESGSMQPGLDRALVQSENAPDFLGAQALHVAKDQDHAVFGWQLGDGAIQNLA